MLMVEHTNMQDSSIVDSDNTNGYKNYIHVLQYFQVKLNTFQVKLDTLSSHKIAAFDIKHFQIKMRF